MADSWYRNQVQESMKTAISHIFASIGYDLSIIERFASFATFATDQIGGYTSWKLVKTAVKIYQQFITDHNLFFRTKI